MHTHIEFISNAFPPYPNEEEEINPGLWGKRLAEYIVSKLPDHGLTPKEIYAEDWGWEIPIENKAFPIFIGCGMQDAENNHFLCFVDPSQPKVKIGWFKSIDGSEDIMRVVEALEMILTEHTEIGELYYGDIE